MRRPNFFLVGAAKAGTTAMDDYLRQHPEIHVPDRKEIHFFGSDLTIRYTRPTEKEYLDYFRCAPDKKRLGESSVWYLVSKRAASEIKAFSPDAKIIIMLRNPVDAMYSLHSEHVFRGYEDIEDFAAALDAEEDRKKGLRIPKWAGVTQAVLYRDVVRYTGQVERYFDVFGRENVHVIIFDDFKADTLREYRRTLEFLGVDPDFAPEFNILNPNKQIRSKLLLNLLYNTKFARSFRFRRWIPEFLRAAMRRFNTRYVPRPPMAADLRRQLQAEFAPEVERLGELLGRDLAHWTAEREPVSSPGAAGDRQSTNRTQP